MIDRMRQMRETVRKELVHIPDYPPPQGELRMVYWGRRMHSLGKKAARDPHTAKEVLEESIAYLKKYYSNFAFQYDKKFFDKA
jgi:hypothetical protein